MISGDTPLSLLAKELENHPAVREKFLIRSAYAPAESVNHGIALGDDCAAIPDEGSGGFLLFAAEGMLDSFVNHDPWFAGYSAVMVNLSDIAAMGGRPIAITDIIWSGDAKVTTAIWQGMQAAAIAYNVPIVGGHTTQNSMDHGGDGKVHLAAAVIGRAGKQLLTSFDAKVTDRLVIAIDMEGAFQQGKPFWNASTTSSPMHLRETLDLLPQLAEKGYANTCKDISNGGIIGTLAMLCECSGVGVELNLDQLPIPQHTDMLKWLTAFPSFGYLFAVSEENLTQVIEHFSKQKITIADIGSFTAKKELTLTQNQNSISLQFNV